MEFRRVLFRSKGEHSQGRPGHFQYQGQRLSTGCGPPVSGRNPDDPVLRDPCRVRQNRCGDCVMDATLVLIDSDAELARARVLVDRLWKSDLPTDIARLQDRKSTRLNSSHLGISYA